MKDLKMKLPPGHKKPVTRREFVGLGLAQATSTIMLPTFLNTLLNPEKLFATTPDCTLPALSSNFLPFIVFDLMGGASLSGNFLVGGPGGPTDYLPDYRTLGIPDSTSPASLPKNTDFGLPMWSGTYVSPLLNNQTLPISSILSGFTQSCQLSTRQMTALATIPSISQDDSGVNLLNPLHVIMSSGLSGRYLKSISTNSTLSGGGSDAAMGNFAYKPVPVLSQNALTNVLGFGQTLSGFSVKRKQSLLKLVSNLSSSQVSKFSELKYGDEYSTLMSCAGYKNGPFVNPAPGTTAVTDPNVLQAFASLDLANNLADNELTAIAAIAYNVLMGNAAGATIGIGGCDYHFVGTMDNAHAVDLKIGKIIGSVLELARLLNKPLFIAIISDGANVSLPNTRGWAGDDGHKGLAMVGCIDPRNQGSTIVRPSITKQQLGAYTSYYGSGTIADGYLANSCEAVAYALALNYFNAANMRGKFRDIVSDSQFDPKEEDKSIIVNSLPGFG